jgi:hypothetical protein
MAEDKDDSVKKFLNGLAGSVNKKGRSASLKKPSGIDQVEKVLPLVLLQLGLEQRMRQHALMQVWHSLLPASLAERSRPLFMDHQNNLVIGVSDAAAAQELSLMKNKLVQTLSATARTLKVKFASLRFDLKNYHRLEEEMSALEPALPQPSEGELQTLALSNHDMQLICDLSGRLDREQGAKADLSMMILRAFERQLRLAEWRRRHGYPVCQSCRNPVPRLFARGSHKVCFNCRHSD